MVLVEKLPGSPSSYHTDLRTSIGFVIYPDTSASRDEMYLELSNVAARQAIVRLTDQHGRLLMQEEECFSEEPTHTVYCIKNLKPGTYYFEVTDGFFYQVKEVRVP